MDKKNDSNDRLFDVASDLEGTVVDLQRIQRLLQIYAAAYEAERDGLIKPRDSKQVNRVIERLDMLQPIQEAARILLKQCIAELETHAEAIYAEHRKKE